MTSAIPIEDIFHFDLRRDFKGDRRKSRAILASMCTLMYIVAATHLTLGITFAFRATKIVIESQQIPDEPNCGAQ